MGILSSGKTLNFWDRRTLRYSTMRNRSSIGTGTSHPFEAEQG
jgi:hypothetical protein